MRYGELPDAKRKCIAQGDKRLWQLLRAAVDRFGRAGDAAVAVPDAAADRSIEAVVVMTVDQSAGSISSSTAGPRLSARTSVGSVFMVDGGFT